MSYEVKQTLDARGLNCPLPIMRTKTALANLKNRDVLEVLTSDPGSLKDIESFCVQTGHKLLLRTQSQEDFIFHIRK
ncbi:MAG: sulfurtransferase TusA family protein [Gammaproteobacteria bacterium]|nr:sulfurtransferase TusA family protein [Gammaproteobacteria bacterium]